MGRRTRKESEKRIYEGRQKEGEENRNKARVQSGKRGPVGSGYLGRPVESSKWEVQVPGQ